MLVPLLTNLFVYLLIMAAPLQVGAKLPASATGDKAKIVKTRMLRAFGGKKDLSKIESITYTLSRKTYKEGDTVSTKQLWYMHLQQPLVVRLDITGTDTTAVATTTYKEGKDTTNEAKAAYEALLRARFFNFLYLLTTPEAEFTYLSQSTYRNSPVDIVRVTSSQNAQWTLDLFVNKKGEVVTSSSVNPTSGKYERFGDEYAYEKVAGNIVFPLQYRIVQQDKVLSEGLFSELQVNKLSPAWEKQLKRLGIGL
ncbi:hypothetical protein [Pontibacter ruber]|uniref:Outer membrane lipoprotein-sorting protein n=1 Tax=Pontibacter ruber TaxID=1343895 RepID=A0ABW5D0S9_9BACT|nr:hypothetical protein [Pontibacter ruber]